MRIAKLPFLLFCHHITIQLTNKDLFVSGKHNVHNVYLHYCEYVLYVLEGIRNPRPEGKFCKSNISYKIAVIQNTKIKNYPKLISTIEQSVLLVCSRMTFLTFLSIKVCIILVNKNSVNIVVLVIHTSVQILL